MIVFEVPSVISAIRVAAPFFKPPSHSYLLALAGLEVFVAMRQLTNGMEEAELLLEKSGIDNRTRKTALQAEAHLISVMTLEQKGALFRECVHSLW